MAGDYLELRAQAMRILQEEASLEEIVRLVGVEALSPMDRIILFTAKSLREDFLHQHAFDPQDQYTTMKKQYGMLKAIIHFHNLAVEALERETDIEKITRLPVRGKIARMKFIPEDKLEVLEGIISEMEQEYKSLQREEK